MTRPPRQFAQVTEQLRDEYTAQLHAVDVEIQELNKQTAAGEFRLAAIARDLEQHADSRLELEQELLAAQGQTPQTDEQNPAAAIELLELKLQLLQAEVEVLETERAWLTRRAPLQDMLLSVAQVRRDGLQADLATLKQGLETAFYQAQSTLSSQATTLQQQLQQATNPVESFVLTLRLETVDIQKETAEYQHRLHLLGEDIVTQENRNARVKQDVDRMTSLVEKYASGEGMAQRLLVTFERLRDERLRYNDAPAKNLESQLQTLTSQLFTLDDQLYDFKPHAESRLAKLEAQLQSLPVAQRSAELTKIHQELEAQKTALRAQQQVLSTLMQDTTKLFSLHRDYRRLLDDSYLFVLARMFWLRDARTLDWNAVQDMRDGVRYTLRRGQTMVSAATELVQTTWSSTVYPWLLTGLVGLLLPWSLFRLWRYLGAWQLSVQQAAPELSLSRGIGAATALVLRTAIWPGYLALIAWLLGMVFTQMAEQRALAMALVQGLQLSAGTLGVVLLASALLHPEGWGKHLWGLTPRLSQFLWHVILALCVAVLLFLVPRSVLLLAPGYGPATPGSLALARFFYLAFQIVVVICVGVLGRRSSPLMETVLARSQQHDGLFWRIWPFVHLLLVTAVLGLVALDVLGFRYAARFIWLRALGSLSVVLLMRVLLVLLVLRCLRAVVTYVFSIGGRLRLRYPDVEAAAARYFRMVSLLCQGVLAILAAVVILELWGFSASWFVTSPLGAQLLTRVVIVALTLGAAMVVVQMSNALADYLLQPRITLQGRRREPSRKLKTLAPLIQTLIKVGAVFAGILVVLEQLGISTGPILTGVGIFGLAVGFASQSLIKDVINGLFILFEDSLSVGDVVTLREITGQVEKVTLRAVTIRDLSGNVHVIPNGTIDMIANMTKDYSRYVLDIGVAYRENVDVVMRLLREIDEAMRQDPVYATDMLEPIEILGLDRFEDSAVVIRARLKTRPLHQWRVGREFNRRLKTVFDERGIEMPFPQRTLHFDTAKEGGQPVLRLVMEPDQPARREDDF